MNKGASVTVRIQTFVLLLLAHFTISTAVGKAVSEMNRSEQLAALKQAYEQQFKLSKSGSESADPMLQKKCAFPTAHELFWLEQSYGKIAGFEEVLARPSVEDFPLTFDSPGGHFKIHYTRATGDNDRVDEVTWPDLNSNGIPEYVEIVARIVDSCWDHHVDELGYRPPVNDEPYDGGDSRYDVYIKDQGPNYYGATNYDKFITTGGMTLATTWLELDNRYQEYPTYSTRPIAALQVTMAHEFFHAIQLAYDAYEPCLTEDCGIGESNPYWLEMSSVWMEEETYDNVNDYYGYIEYYMNTIDVAPYRALNLNNGLAIYGAGLFPIFLAEEYGAGLIRLIWEKCGDAPLENFFLRAIQDAIPEYTNGATDFEDAWTEYSRWLFFTGTRTRPGRYFEEAANYSMIPDSTTRAAGGLLRPYIRYFSDYPITSQQSADNPWSISELGINYIDFRTASLDSAFSLNFNGVTGTDPSIEWRISIIAYDRFNTNGVFRPHPQTYHNPALIQEHELGSISDILMIPTIVNPELVSRDSRYTYRFSVSDTSITFAANTISVGNSRFSTSDPDPNKSRLVVIYELKTAAEIDFSIYTVAGEKIYQSATRSAAEGSQEQLIWMGVNDDNEEVASGVYILQARIGDDRHIQKIFVTR